LRFLLDTHTLLWVSTAPEFLSDRANELFSQPNHDFFVSAVSSFELATKHRLGKLRQAEKLLIAFEKHMEVEGFHLLPISSLHGRTAGAYEQAHKDPFDRILAAQAKLETLILLSADAQLDTFGVERVW
jgi:PIN domain nuclease of toxin-antitoxin system